MIKKNIIYDINKSVYFMCNSFLFENFLVGTGFSYR